MKYRFRIFLSLLLSVLLTPLGFSIASSEHLLDLQDRLGCLFPSAACLSGALTPG